MLFLSGEPYLGVHIMTLRAVQRAQLMAKAITCHHIIVVQKAVHTENSLRELCLYISFVDEEPGHLIQLQELRALKKT